MRYEDGDAEDMAWEELHGLLERDEPPAKKPSAGKAAAAAQHGRRDGKGGGAVTLLPEHGSAVEEGEAAGGRQADKILAVWEQGAPVAA